MQAIILAAGMGKRLKELTQDNTKCMVKVNGVRLIDRALSQLAKLNLKRTVIVTGYEGAKLRKHVGRKWDGMRIDYVDNPSYPTAQPSSLSRVPCLVSRDPSY